MPLTGVRWQLYSIGTFGFGVGPSKERWSSRNVRDVYSQPPRWGKGILCPWFAGLLTLPNGRKISSQRALCTRATFQQTLFNFSSLTELSRSNFALLNGRWHCWKNRRRAFISANVSILLTKMSLFQHERLKLFLYLTFSAFVAMVVCYEWAR